MIPYELYMNIVIDILMGATLSLFGLYVFLFLNKIAYFNP